ncbi:hypothetical protein Y032_0050g1885 [Ancylostoma ceylanicum]|uniref:Uncharacterized protein n=1 Tax=Ancylostoma ceylanicum TaxID=53326 RepID=A0A016U942_9BILA|nr:hypothetical protein Y032_0050g1885 [Ancylostoma ceylanicum]
MPVLIASWYSELQTAVDKGRDRARRSRAETQEGGGAVHTSSGCLLRCGTRGRSRQPEPAGKAPVFLPENAARPTPCLRPFGVPCTPRLRSYFRA